ncbi:MAG: hypothetical protein ABI663_17795 [Chryseolinea sp.]
MAQQNDQLTELLLQQERELVEKLAAIRTLLGKPSDDKRGEPTSTTIMWKKTVKKEAEGIPKKDASWESYAQKILKELGGRSKAQPVITYAIKANPREDRTTVENAIRGKLSRLYREGVIGAEVGESKKAGYTFFIKQTDLVDK